MRNVPENELFSAYLDGELTADEQAQMERLLATSPAARQLMEELRALSSTLQVLPQHKLDEDLSERVLRLAERRMLAEPAVPETPHDLPSPEPIAWRPILRRVFKPRNLLWPAVAAAVAIFLMMTDSGRFPPSDHPEVAFAPETADEATGTSGPAVLEKAGQELAESAASAASKESEKSLPGMVYKDGRFDAFVERGGSAGQVAAPTRPVVPEAGGLARRTDGPATGPGLPQVPETPMPEVPITEEPAAVPGIGKTLGPSPGTADSDGAGGGFRPAVPPVTGPGGLAGGVPGRDLDPANSDLPPSGPEGAVPGPRPTPVAPPVVPPAVPPGDQQPIRHLLVLRCNITAEAARGRVFDRVLSVQRFTRAKTDARGSQGDRYFYSRGLLENQDAAEGSGAKPEKTAEQIQFDVEATPAQLRAIVADLMSRPDEFSFVSDLTPLGIAATRLGSLNGRHSLAVDERFGVHRFDGARARSDRADAEGEGSADRRALKHGGLDPAGPDAGYEPKGLGTKGQGDRPTTVPKSPAEAAPREAEGGTLPEGKPAAEPAAEPVAEPAAEPGPSQVLPQLDQPGVPPEEAAPADLAEQTDEEERVREKPVTTPDARGAVGEPDEEQAVPSNAPPSEPPPSESPPPGEPRDRREEADHGVLPDDGAEKVLVRFVFLVVRPDVPIAADVLGRQAEQPAAAAEVEAAHEIMEPPAAEAAPAETAPAAEH